MTGWGAQGTTVSGRLTALHLGGNAIGRSEPGVHNLASDFTNLISLQILSLGDHDYSRSYTYPSNHGHQYPNGNDLSDESVSVLARNVSALVSLKRLELRDNISYAGICALALSLRNLRCLRALNVEENRYGRWGGGDWHRAWAIAAHCAPSNI